MRAFWTVLAVVAVDQLTKYTVVQTMYRGQSIPLIGDWLRFTYTENPGMAFGIRIGFPALVTIFAILATALILVYMVRIGHAYKPYRYSLSLVLGGAFGNIIDRVFYGAILYDEPYFLGRVVDFIHVNLWRGQIPESVPFFGGDYMALFPIWNVADMAIVAGVVGIIAFQRSFHEQMARIEVGAAGGPEAPDVEDGAEVLSGPRATGEEPPPEPADPDIDDAREPGAGT